MTCEKRWRRHPNVRRRRAVSSRMSCWSCSRTAQLNRLSELGSQCGTPSYLIELTGMAGMVKRCQGG
jgi:hypothetical protein